MLCLLLLITGLASIEKSALADGELPIVDFTDIKEKFEPGLWYKIQELEMNGTERCYRIIMRLVNSTRRLKEYIASLLIEAYNATIYYVGKIFPVVIVDAPILKIKEIAAYSFVVHLGDGEAKGAYALDVSVPTIKADDVWALGYDGSGINVSIIDSGIDDSHVVFQGKTIIFRDFAHNMPEVTKPASATQDWANISDPVGHGTHAGSIAVGNDPNNQFDGVAHGVETLIVAALGSSPTKGNAVASLDWAVNKSAQVISCTCGWQDEPKDGTGGLSMAADDAVEKGAIVVVTAHNYGESGAGSVTSPGTAFNVITIGASDDGGDDNLSNDVVHNWSGKGPTADGRPKPDVVAPGVNIWSADPVSADSQGYDPGAWCNFEGTSAATPHVAGTVALMLEANPNLTPAQIKGILRQTANLTNILSGYVDGRAGHGIIDAYEAVQLAQNISDIDRNHMYDSWNVSTYPEHGWGYEYVTFTVNAPNTTFGISLSDIHYHYKENDYKLIRCLSAQHVWINDVYYHLGNDMQKYLFSGPRIYDRQLGEWVKMRAWYQVGNVSIEYNWIISKNHVKLQLSYNGGSVWKTLIYTDIEVWDTTNIPQLSSSETILIEKKFTEWEYIRIRDLDHTEYVLFEQHPLDNPITWVLREGYYGNNPEEAKNDQYVYNRDIILYYQSQGWQDPYGKNPTVIITRETDTLPPPDPTQNDANTGGDAGNTLNNATSISLGSYQGILCDSDPTDTNDYYKFYAESSQNIYVNMTPPPDLDFNLELYDPNENLTAGSYNGAGCTDSVFYTADSSGNWTTRIYISNGEGQYSFDIRIVKAICAMKTRTNGNFYVPNLQNITTLKIEFLMNNSDIEGDQVGASPPYQNITKWPNERVRVDDLTFIYLRFGDHEGGDDWTLEHYLADIIADRRIRVNDSLAANLNFGKDGEYDYNLTEVYVRFDTDQTNYFADDHGFVSIPEGKTTFTTYRNGNTIGALVTVWCFNSG